MRRALVLLLLLSACATPRAACLSRAQAPLNALDAEIAEVQTALAVGYRVAPGSGFTAGMSFCAEGSPVTLCMGGTRPVGERRIAIDRAAEEARLKALKARRAAVASQAAHAASVCPAA